MMEMCDVLTQETPILRTAPIGLTSPPSTSRGRGNFMSRLSGWFKDTEGNILAVSQRL